VIGSGTFLPDPARACAAHHLASGRISLLLDCGPGALTGLQRRGIDWGGLTHVAFSHEHLDHTGGFPHLMFALKHAIGRDRDEPLHVLGTARVLDLVRDLRAAWGAWMLAPGFPVELHRIRPGSVRVPVAERGVTLSARPTPHTDHSVALRIELSGTAIGYTGDTGPADELGAFLEGSDLLVSECAGSDASPVPGHLAPADVARLAGCARPDLLVVTHVYPPETPRSAADAVRSRYGGRVLEGTDGLRLVFRRGAWIVDPEADGG